MWIILEKYTKKFANAHFFLYLCMFLRNDNLQKKAENGRKQ